MDTLPRVVIVQTLRESVPIEKTSINPKTLHHRLLPMKLHTQPLLNAYTAEYLHYTTVSMQDVSNHSSLQNGPTPQDRWDAGAQAISESERE